MTGKFLSRDEILRAKDIETVEVDVPEWGGKVRMRGMTGTERDAFEAENFQVRGRNTKLNFENLRARLLVRCIVDNDGKPMFSKGDIDSLGNKSCAAIQRLFNVAQKLNGLSGEDIEELVGNSDETPGDTSTSA